MINFYMSCILMMLAVVSGCGDSGPLLIPVTGTLSLDGQPLGFKAVTLLPIEGTPGHGASGYTDGAGSLTLLAIVPGAIRDFKGCPPGRYQVVITEPLLPLTEESFRTASQSEVNGENEPAVAVFMPKSQPKRTEKGVIPSIYTSATSSPLVAEVAEGSEIINLELNSKAT